ncbi:uncharacterized protein MONOS_275 [Monocercomonoides exilis]|uniref:uncharacterized protein n=1 Tax=Monocercomonoides exilis TaxID=2049356 RepID=UPI00355A0963|nr:hypothetical protein MONOS_275 [Monocercomonoides exilis]|eukprot:MONOS_275.1-p1 / transcript=MONOS_275.1 / gene=MONOS_275 / organism=Monocercomonoides_exilis_PA203 / gene_product=unspecified product / transcript_product=unspecified product / location=Mono_scaffold00004:265296-267437(-) / protein_length=714 / sequence_SO=supercontig / SO=protein_coding / is_pseudo=false
MPKLMNDQLDENIRFSSDCFSWWNNERIRKESIQNSKSLSYSSFNHGAFDQSLWTNETGTTSAEFRKGDEDDLNRLSTLSPKSVESPENSEGRAIEKKRTSQSRLRGQSRSPNETSHQPISRSVRKPKRRSRRRSWFSSRKKRRRAAERMRMRNEAASEESEQTAEEETVSDEEYKEAHRRSRKAEKGEEGDDEGNEEEEEEEEGEKEDDEKEAEAEEDSRDAESDPFMSMSSTDSQEIRRSSEKSKEKPKQKQELTQRSKQELSIQQKYPSMASQKAQLLMPIASFNPLHFSSKLPSALNSHSLSNSMTSLAAQAQQQFTQHQLSGADSIHSSFSSDALNNHPASASSSSSSYRSNVPSFSNFPEFASAFALTSSSGTSLPSSVELLASKAKRGRSQIGKGDLIDENQPNESTHGHQIPARTLPSSSASSSSFPSSATNTREDFGFSTHSNIPLPFSSNTSSASFRAQSASQQASNSTSFAPSSSTAPSLLGSSMPTAPKYSSFNSLSAFQALHRSPYPVQRAAPALSYNQQSAVSTKPSFFGANPLLVSGNSSALLSSSNPASFSSTSPSSASASSSSSSHLTSPPRNSSFTSSSSFHSNTTTDSASSYHSPHTHTSASFNPSPFSQMNLPISPSPLSHPQRTPSLSSSPLHASSPTVSISPPTIPVKNLKIHLKANNSLQGKEQKVLKQFTSFEQDENIRTKESQLNLPS